MRTLRLTILITFAAIAGASVASAQGMYASVIGGVNFTHDGEFAGVGVDSEFDTGYVVGGNVGYDFGDYRLEGEISYRANDLDNIGGFDFSPSSITTTALMANAFYDFDTGSPFVPYAGVGLGVGFSTLELLGIEGDVTAFAYQFILGGAYGMTDALELTLDYRYFSMGSPDYEFAGGDLSQEYINSSIVFGVRTRF
jgi:opacity protein-like surface antigen